MFIGQKLTSFKGCMRSPDWINFLVHLMYFLGHFSYFSVGLWWAQMKKIYLERHFKILKLLFCS